MPDSPDHPAVVPPLGGMTPYPRPPGHRTSSSAHRAIAGGVPAATNCWGPTAPASLTVSRLLDGGVAGSGRSRRDAGILQNQPGVVVDQPRREVLGKCG